MVAEPEHKSPRFAVAIFARHRGRILLVRTTEGSWGAIRGRLIADETPVEAAWRLLWEATGLFGRFANDAGADEKSPGLVGYREHRTDEGLSMLLTFVADVPNERIEMDDGIAETRWISSPEESGGPPALVEVLRAALDAGRSDHIRIARAWIQAVNAHDPERLVAIYAHDGEHATPEVSATGFQSRAVIGGKDALLIWWTRFLEAVPGLRYEERVLASGNDRVMMECVRTCPDDEPCRIALTFICSDGRIASSYVYRS